MMSYEIRIQRLLLVVLDHGLDIGQHVLSLSVASVFTLTLLDGGHATVVLHDPVAGSMILLVALLS